MMSGRSWVTALAGWVLSCSSGLGVQEGQSEASRCASSDDCAPGRVCVDDRCRARCEQDWDCGDGEECSNRVCRERVDTTDSSLGLCATGETKCDEDESRILLTCNDVGEWDEELCPALCRSGVCNMPPSCASGSACADNESCCQSLYIPAGEFLLAYDNVDDRDRSYARAVGPFWLDRWEVTVGRFERFVNAFPASRPKAGAGKHPRNDSDPGWDSAWELPETKDELIELVSTCDERQGSTWVGNDSSLPMNCVDWRLAFAFCIWDGGRLPTEAEWNYAASGGDEHRVFPWSDPPNDPAYGAEHAVIPIWNEPALEAPQPVGSRPTGDGRWQHGDLVGNVWEWLADYYEEPPASGLQTDYLATTANEGRAIRGGAYDTMKRNAERGWQLPDSLRPVLGFRCARDEDD